MGIPSFRLGVSSGQLWKAGVSRIYIDGSFVEDKDHPNDIDGYFECALADLASGRLQRDLNRQDPFKVWTWDRATRRADPNSTKKQLPMWHIYRVELYPHTPGKGSGITDLMGHELEFPSAFRRTRSTGRPKGIVELRQCGT